MIPRTLRVALASFALLCGAATEVFAQDVAAAEALFREGRALLDAGDLPTACAKLAESQRLDPSSGTLLNLASCHERQGKTATAWGEYLAAARMARAQGKPTRVQEATDRASALEPRLSHVTIRLAASVPGVQVLRDEVRLEVSAVGSRLPTDPGKHLIRVVAPGYEPRTVEVVVGENADDQTLVVPPLTPLAGTAAKTETPPRGEATRDGGTRASVDDPASAKGGSKLPWIVGGTGVVFLGAGGVFGLVASTSYANAEKQCPSHESCSDKAMAQRTQAETLANLANVGIGLGIVGIGVGAVLLFTADSGDAGPKSAQGLVVEPSVGRRAAGVTLRGAL